MATTSPLAAGDSQISWTSLKKKPRPHSCSANTFQVSRNSGLNSEVGTFGGSSRFGTGTKVIGYGASSPDGRDFYKRNPLYKTSLERGLECSMGIGGRPEPASSKLPTSVGPGSYEIVASAAKKRSPLDGPEYCTTSIHRKLPSKLVPADLCSPGPHHKYEIRKPLDHDRPKYALSMMHHQARHPFPEDRDSPGPGHYPQTHNTVSGNAMSQSAPDLARTVKSTFGMSDRFKTSGVPSSSPNGDYYYSHYKPKDAEDYLASTKTCSFGKGNKTDFANPYNGPTFQVSPVSYAPVTSMAKATSALDGLTCRLQSPIKAHCAAIMEAKKKSARRMSTARAAGMRGEAGAPAATVA